MIPKRLERELGVLVKAYEDWLDDKVDLADADLISAVGEFCRIVRDVIPATSQRLSRRAPRRRG